MATGSPGGILDRPPDLLERSQQLAMLEAHLTAVVEGGHGRVVLVSGEAGVGKTALLRRFCEASDEARVLWGACEGLFTPSPLGPLVDVARSTPGEFAHLVEVGALPHDIGMALLRELGVRTPTLLVLEDVHSADGATLDVLRVLSRRLVGVTALVIVSYRDTELGPSHPLRQVLGQLASDGSSARLRLAPFSVEAVAQLAEPFGADAAALYRMTGGNPFFVTEALAAGEEELPSTVRDAVLAHAARLGADARRLLEAVAITPPQAEVWLLEAIAGDVLPALDECLASGMLTRTNGAVTFRHELARLAVEETVAPDRELGLHRAVLATLEASSAGVADLARLAHHADAAGDADAALRYAPAAATRASALGAHREAGAQYARALRFAGELPLEARAALLEQLSNEHYLTDDFKTAIEAMEAALDCYRTLGDIRKQGTSLGLLARLYWCPGRTEEAARAAQQAVTVFEQLPPGQDLAMAYESMASLRMNLEDIEPAIEWGTRAIALAEVLGDDEVVVRALNDVGTSEFLVGRPEGREKLERSLELARRAGLDAHVGRAYVHLVWAATRQRLFDLAVTHLDAGLTYCRRRDLELWSWHLIGDQARIALDQGRWDDAAEAAALVLREPRTSISVPVIQGLCVLGLLRARRGDPSAWDPLEEAQKIAKPSGGLQESAPVASARAEAAWLEGDHSAVQEATDSVFWLAIQRKSPWVAGELASWRRRAGICDDIPAWVASPYAAQLNGDWRRAAEQWNELKCPYEKALALADADDDAALREALDDLNLLGARRAAAIVARRLRERGIRKLPRGPRPATRANPAGLTARELEVLELVGQGLRNGEIAARLVLSERTIDHHVGAILRKLGVRTRAEARTDAVRLGLRSSSR